MRGGMQAELAKDLRQSFWREMGIQAARVGQHPHQCISHSLRLETDLGFRPVEGDSIRADAQHRDRGGPIFFHLHFERPAPGPELLAAEVGRPKSGPMHQVGNPVAESQQLMLFLRPHQPVSEPGGEQGRPESVAGPGKVMPCPGGIKSRINAAESTRKPQAITSGTRRFAAESNSARVGRRPAFTCLFEDFIPR